MRSGPRERTPRLDGALLGTALVAVLALLLTAGCKGRDQRFSPDATLRKSLGLTDRDEVHRVTLVGADTEQVRPSTVEVPRGAWVEFVTGDWRVHEVHFELDSLGEAARAFLRGTDQVSSPPLVDRDSRFVIHFEEAPPGRYPFVAEGNGAPGHGVVVVRPKP